MGYLVIPASPKCHAVTVSRVRSAFLKKRKIFFSKKLGFPHFFEKSRYLYMKPY